MFVESVKRAILENEELLPVYEGIRIWLGIISFVVELDHSTTT